MEYFIGLYCNLFYVPFKIIMHTMIHGNRSDVRNKRTRDTRDYHMQILDTETMWGWSVIMTSLSSFFSIDFHFLHFLIYLIIFIKNYRGGFIFQYRRWLIYMLYIFFITSFINFGNC